MSKISDCVVLGASATLGVLLSSGADNLESLTFSRDTGPDVVQVTTPPIENRYDSRVTSRIVGVPIPIQGTEVWEFRDVDGKLIAVPQQQVPQLSEGDFVEIQQWNPLRPYQALQAHKE